MLHLEAQKNYQNDIDYMLNQANQNKLIEVYKMGDIRNITKIKGDTIYEYAGYIIGNS